MKRRKVVWTVVIILSVLTVAASAYWHWNYGPTKFDRDLWLKSGDVEFGSEAPRLQMADGLVRSGVLMDKTYQEVESMLGPAPPTGYFPNYSMVYWLGPERGFISIDSEWLAIHFTNAGIADKACILRD